jgi:hypothetical protein
MLTCHSAFGAKNYKYIIASSDMFVLIIYGRRMRIEQLTESTVLCLHKNLREAISPGNHVPCHVPESCIQRKVKISTHISKR